MFPSSVPAASLSAEWARLSDPEAPAATQEAAAAGGLVARAGHVLVKVPSAENDKIPEKFYAIGGISNSISFGGKQAVAAVQRWDNKGQWSEVGGAEAIGEASLLRKRHAAAVVGSKIYIIGGEANDGTFLGDVLVFDTQSETWSLLAVTGKGPSPRSSHSATAVDNLIYIIGGRSADAIFSGVYILDTETSTWLSPQVLGSPVPKPLHSHAALRLPSGRILLVGGSVGPKEANEDVWFLEVSTAFIKQMIAASSSPSAPIVAWSQGLFDPPPKPVVICGPSGVGKGTLISRLMADFPQSCGFSVSHTTRRARPGEVDGVHYHFVAREVMEKEIEDGKFLEKADVHGNLYGTSVAAVKKVADEGKICILDIDVQGAQQVKANPNLEATFVFIQPPSFEELEKRLRGRGTETEEQIQKRLNNAKAEIERGKDKDLFPTVIVNDDLDKAYEKLKSLLGFSLSPDSASAASQDEEAANQRWNHMAVLLGSRVIFHGGESRRHPALDDLHIIETNSIFGGAPFATKGLIWEEFDDGSPSPLGNFLAAFGLPPAFGLSSAFGLVAPSQAPSPRHSHTGVAIADNRILVVGGEKEGGESAETFTLTLNGLLSHQQA